MAAAVFASIGPRMVSFTLDTEQARLTPCSEVELPARVRYACTHPNRPFLYAACGPGDNPNTLGVLRFDADGGLKPVGEPMQLPAQPMEAFVDPEGRFLFIVYDKGPGLTVHPLDDEGGVGAPIPAAEPFIVGTATHHAAVLSDTHGVLVALGKRGFGTEKYIDGSFELFRYGADRIESLQTLKPSDTAAMRGFNPRNIELHPTLPLAFVSIEGQNKLGIFQRDGDAIRPDPLFLRDVLAAPEHIHKRQNLGSVHIHPRGHVVYLANRNDGYVNGHAVSSWLNPEPIPVFPGGENNIAVFGLNPETGEPTLLQHIDSEGLHPRTFSLDPDAQLMVVGNIAPTRIAANGETTDVPANLSLYRVLENGTLAFAHRHDVDVGSEKLWWSEVVDLSPAIRAVSELAAPDRPL